MSLRFLVGDCLTSIVCRGSGAEVDVGGHRSYACPVAVACGERMRRGVRCFEVVIAGNTGGRRLEERKIDGCRSGTVNLREWELSGRG